MRVLLVTGQIAKEMVEGYARESPVETSVLALRVPVAALLTPRQIAREIRKMDLRGFDMILVPGLITGDVSIVEKTVSIPAFKGPRYAADLPAVLDALGQMKLSKTVPACDLLKDELLRKALEDMKAVEKDQDALLKNSGNMLIGGLAVGRDFPMRIMAEIIDAPLLSDEELRKRARRYVESGAEIIDVGMIAGEARPKDAERAVKAVKEAVNVPVSIDTLDPEEMKSAVSAGVNLILSVDAGNAEDVAQFAHEVTVVVIPTNHRGGHFPKEAMERVKALEENIKRVTQLGMTKVVGDLILDPVNVPGTLESLVAYHGFARRNPSIPLLFGVGNVTELMDADSPGINALLAGLASEVGASILLTTEGSDKARGSVGELATASRMMFLAKRRSSVPKDLGLDLLLLKDKRNREEPYSRRVEMETQVIMAKGVKAAQFDPRGHFKIMVDRDGESIVALHFSTAGHGKPDAVIKGKDAEEVYMKIIEMDLITRLDHAAYLGRELGKAEIALKTGKGYIQDNPMFS